MARHFTPKRLTNILDAIADIETLTRGRTLDHYRSDRFMRLAVERCLEIISEASRFIPEELRAAHPALRPARLELVSGCSACGGPAAARTPSASSREGTTSRALILRHFGEAGR